MRWFVLVFLVVGAVGTVVYQTRSRENGTEGTGETMVDVAMPDLDGAALRGHRVFNENCAACHGDRAGGIQGAGPPLIHKIYEPGHHGDMAIVLAAERGVQSHHWRFGDMPPVDGITRADLIDVIAFIRAVQRANGIF